MKKVVTFLSLLFVIVAFSSCSQTTNKIAESEDETITEDPKATAIAERAKKFKDEADKIMGDNKFFVSEAYWNKHIDNHFMEFRNPDRSIGASYYIVGNYEFFTSYPSFYNDSLYKVQIRGNLIPYERYDTKAPSQYKSVLELYSQKYGAPDYKRDLPPFSQTPNNGLVPLAIWQVGPKVITIDLNCDSPYYGIDLIIYRKDIADRKDKDEADQAKKNTESDATKI